MVPIREQAPRSASDSRFEQVLVGERLGKEGKNFFDKDSAATVFAPEAKLSEPGKVHILNAHSLHAAELDEDSDKKSNSDQKEAKQPKSIADTLKQKYGDPKQDAPVIAEDKAPKPFQGMMEALESGDEALAYQYSRQFVRYKKTLLERAQKVTEFQRYAMEREGIIPKRDHDSEDPDYEGTKYLFEDDSHDQTQPTQTATSSYKTSLDERTKSLLARALAEEDGQVALSRNAEADAAKLAGTQVPGRLDERSERAKIRAEWSAKITPDRQGRAALYYFFNPTDELAIQNLREVQKVFEAYRNEAGVTIVGLTLNRATPDTLGALSRRLQLQFPLRSGSAFAKQMNISRSPTAVVLVPDTATAIIHEGDWRSFQLDEVIKIVRGR